MTTVPHLAAVLADEGSLAGVDAVVHVQVTLARVRLVRIIRFITLIINYINIRMSGYGY